MRLQLFVVLLIIGCESKVQTKENTENVKLALKDSVFVSEIVSSKPKFLLDTRTIDTFLNKWLSRELNALDEKSLVFDSSLNGKEVWRLTVIPTAGNTYCIRVELDPKYVWEVAMDIDEFDTLPLLQCVYKECHRTNYDSDALFVNFQMNSPIGSHPYADSTANADFKSFREATTNFWHRPFEYKDSGMDGTRFLLEANVNGKYHVVIRWGSKFGDHLSSKYGLSEIERIASIMFSFLRIGDWSEHMDYRQKYGYVPKPIEN